MTNRYLRDGIPVFLVHISLYCAIGYGCQNPSEGEMKRSDIILAEVYDQKLTLAEVEPLLINISSPEDSASQVRNHVEAWVRETLLLHEAERNIPGDVNIDKLVQDYRASLLISNYENVLLKSLLDTVVTASELASYYERNKKQYQLETTILRCHLVKLRKTVEEKDVFQKLWRSDRPDDKTALLQYCKSHATDYLLNDNTWYRQPEIERFLPPGALGRQNMSSGKQMKFTDKEFEYHLRILESVPDKEIAPLSYVSEQVRRYILHKRKIDLLEKIKADIYAREIDGVNIKIHI